MNARLYGEVANRRLSRFADAHNRARTHIYIHTHSLTLMVETSHGPTDAEKHLQPAVDPASVTRPPCHVSRSITRKNNRWASLVSHTAILTSTSTFDLRTPQSSSRIVQRGRGDVRNCTTPAAPDPAVREQRLTRAPRKFSLDTLEAEVLRQSKSRRSSDTRRYTTAIYYGKRDRSGH